MIESNTRNHKPLPEGWRWVALSELAQINPRRPADLKRDVDSPTTFVPMAAVDEVKGTVALPELRPFGEIARGFTFFIEGDVLFAKITPCMQNGKHAIGRNLVDGIGFASTEFHVIRPCEGVAPEWIHFFLRQPAVLMEAERHFVGAVGQQRVTADFLAELSLPVPPTTDEQRRIAAILREQMAAIDRARVACEAQVAAVKALGFAYIRESLGRGPVETHLLAYCLNEIKHGIGDGWRDYRLVGAFREGIAPAKEGVGKQPHRYKPVTAGTVFYNPMRIQLGSIAFVDEGDEPGITSPDYVAVRGRDGVLDSRWFYYWFRSPLGEGLIDRLSRGAVRERILFTRLAKGEIELPPYDVQLETSQKLRHLAGLQRRIEAQRDAINALPAAVLRRAFNGEV